ncbi:MAG: calcium-binding protein [Novosphingobium sp.]
MPIDGTAGADSLTGTIGNDVINGLAGNDLLDGGAGDDILNGGDDNDLLIGGSGSDQMFGGGGDDYFYEHIGGTDQMVGGDGNDRFDIFLQMDGPYGLTVDGGAGDDRLDYTGVYGSNYVITGDTLIAAMGAGNDRATILRIDNAQIDMGAGRDYVSIEASSNSASITLGGDADIFEVAIWGFGPGTGTIEVTDFQAGAGGDQLRVVRYDNGHPIDFTVGNPFAEGFLRLVQQGADTAVQWDRDATGSLYAYQTVAVLRGVTAAALTQENIGFPLTGSAIGAAIDGTAGLDFLLGQGGSDTIHGLGGDDTLWGSGGNDLLYGGDGSDELEGGAGNDQLFGEDGADRLYSYSGGSDSLSGGLGNDVLEVSLVAGVTGGTMVLDGGDGGDLISFFRLDSSANDTVTALGGAGDDSIFLSPVLSGTIDAGAGADTVSVTLAGGNVTVTLGEGFDRLFLQQPVYGAVPLSNAITVTDFATGPLGDHISFDLLGGAQLVNYANTDATRSGHVRFVQSGADTLLQFDRDGGADGFVNIATFQNTTASQFLASQFESVPSFLIPQAGTLGTAGADTFVGSSLDDITYAGAGNDTLFGGDGQDVLAGEAGDDVLHGGAGDDSLLGGAGADQLGGGTGDDIYWVDRQADLIFEADGEGFDAVWSTASFYLYANVEALNLTSGTGNLFGVGNELDNIINGNEGNNLLLGGSGDDFFNGNNGNDVIFGESGADWLFGGFGVDYLAGGIGNDNLRGDEGADSLYGEDGDDVLFGGADFFTDILVGGAGNDAIYANSHLGDYDILNGGAGNDAYYVDTPADIIYEGANEGTDTVYAEINGAGYYLWANVENCTLIGATPFAAGNDLNNLLIGSDLSNWLLGNGGSDTLNGGAGNDVLFGDLPGGHAADVFVFDASSGQDVIGDFHHGEDKIRLTTYYADFAGVSAHFIQNGADGAIDLGGGNLIVLQGVQMSTLTASDFIFG